MRQLSTLVYKMMRNGPRTEPPYGSEIGNSELQLFQKTSDKMVETKTNSR